MSESHPAIATVLSLLVVSSIVGNTLVCVVIKRNRDMRTPINYLLVNLAVSDILFAVFYIPKIVLGRSSSHLPGGVPGRFLCTLLTDGSLSWVSAASTVLTLIVIAMERYYTVIYPRENKRKITMYKLRFILPGIWIFSGIIHVREFAKEVDHNVCIYVWPDPFVKVVSVVWHTFVLVSSVLMVGLYGRIVHTLWFRRNDDNELSYQNQGVLKIRKRVTLMVVTISAIFGISWGNHAILHLLDDLGSFQLNPFALPISHVTLMFNSAINPFAYALINQRFREKVVLMISYNPARVHTATELLDIEMVINTTPPTTDPCSRK